VRTIVIPVFLAMAVPIVAQESPTKYADWKDFWVLVVPLVGAFCFGGVLGWITAETVSRAKDLGVKHLAGIVTAILGAAITSTFKDSLLFAWYCIGLAVGYTIYVLIHDFDEEGNLVRRRRDKRS
jgi:hypothetical protein